MGASKVKREGSFFTLQNILSTLYFISGVMLIAFMSLAGGTPPHLGLIGALNIMVSYSLTKMKSWFLYIAMFTSLLSLTFGCTTLIALLALFTSETEEILMLLGIAAYIALSATILAYVMYRRKAFSQ